MWHHFNGPYFELQKSPISRDNFVYVPSQWEMMLQCNIVSHWLGAYTKLSLHILPSFCVLVFWGKILPYSKKCCCTRTRLAVMSYNRSWIPCPIWPPSCCHLHVWSCPDGQWLGDIYHRVDPHHNSQQRPFGINHGHQRSGHISYMCMLPQNKLLSISYI